mmetsp:Transcript_16774/g.40261  ORF Transcript_16774/g.40261 Transcript_16774/m.40261 type:complete len:281 (-) Transcript_16774:100-942(-)
MQHTCVLVGRLLEHLLPQLGELRGHRGQPSHDLDTYAVQDALVCAHTQHLDKRLEHDGQRFRRTTAVGVFLVLSLSAAIPLVHQHVGQLQQTPKTRSCGRLGDLRALFLCGRLAADVVGVQTEKGERAPPHVDVVQLTHQLRVPLSILQVSEGLIHKHAHQHQVLLKPESVDFGPLGEKDLVECAHPGQPGLRCGGQHMLQRRQLGRQLRLHGTLVAQPKRVEEGLPHEEGVSERDGMVALGPPTQPLLKQLQGFLTGLLVGGMRQSLANLPLRVIRRQH